MEVLEHYSKFPTFDVGLINPCDEQKIQQTFATRNTGMMLTVS